MIITSTKTKLPILLVDEETQRIPMPGVSPGVRVSVNGAPFVDHLGDVHEIGDGWYYIVPFASYVLEAGVLVLEASAEGTAEWRDIHQIADAAAVGFLEGQILSRIRDAQDSLAGLSDIAAALVDLEAGLGGGDG